MCDWAVLLQLDPCNAGYLRRACLDLKPNQRVFGLLFDEIISAPHMSFSGGNVEGYAHNDTSGNATSIFVCLLHPLRGGHHMDLMAIPVNTMDQEWLAEKLRKAVVDAESLGFQIEFLGSDNL
jgi:hypothetical protein